MIPLVIFDNIAVCAIYAADYVPYDTSSLDDLDFPLPFTKNQNGDCSGEREYLENETKMNNNLALVEIAPDCVRVFCISPVSPVSTNPQQSDTAVVRLPGSSPFHPRLNQGEAQ